MTVNLIYEYSFPTPLVYNPLFPLLVLSLAKQKNAPTTSTTFKKEYDYIIVGAGSAGSVVASRLSELPCVSVLLLEAGKAPPHVNDVPLMASYFYGTEIDWAYKTVPQKYAGLGLINRQVIWPAGKALGGSSSLNAMLFVRGNKENYNQWAKQGATGWSYKEVFPYFLKMEGNQDPKYLADGYHNNSGPVTVEGLRDNSTLRYSVLNAAKELGYKIADPNGRNQTGFYDIETTTRRGQRCSTAKAYLVPAENRTNLDILANAFVTKVLIKGRRATGVVFTYKKKRHVVRARREVILSAGAVRTPQLLMLSGIGPRNHLQDMNIPVVADLPVGKNLQDHPNAIAPFSIDSSYPTLTEKFIDPITQLNYLLFRTGPLTLPEGNTVLAFLNGLNVSPDIDFPNYGMAYLEAVVEIAKSNFGIKPEVYNEVLKPYEGKPIYLCVSALLQPKSRGTITLQSTNAMDHPIIDPNYYEDDSDAENITQGLINCLRMSDTNAMQKIGSKYFEHLASECIQFANNTFLYMKCVAKGIVVTNYHYCCTSKMGDPRDPTTVVDPKLRVKGIRGLRVVDASIMPIIPSGNTNVPTIMVGEKASDIIKETINCSADKTPTKKPKSSINIKKILF